jgi:predicted MFS family arabinose efflux permease
LLTAAAMFLLGNGALTALLVPYVSTQLRGTAAGVGVLFSALGLGYLIGALPGKFVCANSRLRRNLMALVAAVVAAFAGLFNVHVFAWALVFIGLAGIPGNAFLALQQNLMQRCAPDKVIGRISSVYSTVGNVATVLGGLLASLLVRELGLSLTLNCSIGVIACAGAVAVLLPRSFATG